MAAHEIFYAGVLEAQLIKKVDLKGISQVILDPRSMPLCGHTAEAVCTSAVIHCDWRSA